MNRAEVRANMMAEIDSHMDGVWQKLANDLLAYEQRRTSPGITRR